MTIQRWEIPSFKWGHGQTTRQIRGVRTNVRARGDGGLQGNSILFIFIIGFYFIFSVLLVFCLYIVVSDLVFLWVLFGYVCVFLFSLSFHPFRDPPASQLLREKVRTTAPGFSLFSVCLFVHFPHRERVWNWVDGKALKATGGKGNHDENILYEKFFS